MLDVSRIKITTREKQVLSLLVLGCSNGEIAGELNMAEGTVKEHLRNLFKRAEMRDGRKRIKLALAMFAKEELKSCSPLNG